MVLQGEGYAVEAIRVLVLCRSVSIETPSDRVERSVGSGSPSWLFPAIRAVLARPHLWVTALRVGRRHAPPGWWRRPPFLPLPDADWMSFRYETAFADGTGRPSPDEVVDYLEWVRHRR